MLTTLAMELEAHPRFYAIFSALRWRRPNGLGRVLSLTRADGEIVTVEANDKGLSVKVGAVKPQWYRDVPAVVAALLP